MTLPDPTPQADAEKPDRHPIAGSRPGPGGWDPLVLDRAVAGFDPKPPQGPMHQPDTVVDAWSTADVDVRLASIRGYSHRFYGKPRQDDAVVVFHQPTGCVVFAVADGVSSARFPEVGARLVCRTAVDMIQAALSSDTRGPNWPVLATSVGLRLVEEAQQRGWTRAEAAARASEDYATTLVTGFIRPSPDGLSAAMIQIGDSSAWTLADGRFVDVLTPKTAPGAAVFSSRVAALPDVPDRVEAVTVPLPVGTVFLVGTDGFGDPLGDGSGMVGDLFRGALRSAPPALGFAHAVDFSRETFDDDRTLLAIWPRTTTSS